MFALFDVACVALLLALVLTPLIRDISNRLGWVDHPDSERKWHTSSIPRIGGLAVALSYALSLCFVVVAPYRNITIDIPHSVSSALALAPAALIILAIGLVDDIRGLKPWQKLVAEVIAAVVAYTAGFGIYVAQGQAISDWLSLPITVLWLVACTNALNLIDGMDGLAAGVGVFATLTSFVAALIHGSLELAFVTAPLIGALIGFLRYNFNPASIFLGDSGSLFIGFLLGCFGTLWGQKSATFVGMTAPLIALAIPLLDTTLAVVRRFLSGKPIFMADRGHIHHRLLDRGWTPRRAALVLYGVCGIAAAVSLLQDAVHDEFRGLIIVLFCCAAWLGVQHLGYAEFGVAGRLVLRGAFRRMIDAQLRMQELERTLWHTKETAEAWALIVSVARDLGVVGMHCRIGDQVFSSKPKLDPSSLWQVLVPLPEGEYLSLALDPSQEVQPVVLTSLPNIVKAFILTQPKPASEEFLQHASQGAHAESLPTNLV